MADPGGRAGGEETVDELRRRARAAERAVARLEELLVNERQERRATEAELQQKRERLDDYIDARQGREEDERRRARASLIDELLERVWAPLGRGVEAESETELREGVRIVREEFESVLAEAGVEIFVPEEGAPIDDERHEVLRAVERPERPSDTILQVQSPGFTMDGEIERQAEVFVVA